MIFLIGGRHRGTYRARWAVPTSRQDQDRRGHGPRRSILRWVIVGKRR